MNNNYPNNFEPNLDWSRVSDVAYIQKSPPQMEIPKNQPSANSDLRFALSAGLFIAVLVIASIFGGIVFFDSRSNVSKDDATTEETQNEKTLQRFVNTENLNLRNSPDRMSVVVDILPYNTRVQLLNKTSFVNGKYWVKVKSNNGTVGWVNRDFLK